MNEKNKVNVITINLKNEGGGSYIRMNELVYGMNKKGWKVHHISPKGFRCENCENIIHYKIFYIPIPGGYILSEIQIFFRMLFIVMKNKIDIMVAFGISNSFTCSLVKIFSRHTKLCVSLRSDDIEGFKWGIRNKFLQSLFIKTFKILERVVFKKADLIIFVSNDLKERVMKRVNYRDFEKIKVIHNNSNTSRVMKLSKSESIKFPPNKKIIGYMRGLWEIGGGLKYLIEAFDMVRREIPNSMLVIVGDGPDRQKLVSRVKKFNLENDVMFTGFKSNPIAYLKSFDVLVHPTLHEGSSNTVLEALYCGVPVIASRVGGTPEILKYDDLLFDPQNVEEIASKIINLLKNDDAYRKAVDLCKERKKVFTFDWSGEMIKAIEKTLEG